MAPQQRGGAARTGPITDIDALLRDNVEDALEKMQKAIDSAAKAVIPKAPNLAAKKKINKQYAWSAVAAKGLLQSQALLTDIAAG